MNTTTKPQPNGSRAGLDGHPAAPVAASPSRLRRRPLMLVTAVAMVAFGALLGFLIWSTSSTSVEVVVVRSAVDRGEVISSNDLMLVRVAVDPSVQIVPGARLGDMVGKRAASDLVAGSLLSPTGVSDQLAPATGESIVGVALGTGKLPAEPLRAGDSVRLVQTPADQADVPATQVTIDALVQNVPVLSDDGQTVVVDLLVPSSRAAEVAARAATGRVALVLDSRER